MIPIILPVTTTQTTSEPTWATVFMIVWASILAAAVIAMVIWFIFTDLRDEYSKCSVCGKRIKDKTQDFWIESAQVCKKCFEKHLNDYANKFKIER